MTLGSRRFFYLITPGILVAATGVGAGDLLTASLDGSNMGLALLWAAWVGALLKWFLNEGVARWQMASGTTLLEGWIHRLGPWIQWTFILYMLPWTFFTAGALVTACGVAGTGIWQLGDDIHVSKVIWGVIHSAAGAALVLAGGFELAAGIAIPTIPEGGLVWVLAILGGVGGTVTLLSYGYWIRERGRTGAEGVRMCRIDLAIGYAMTALFGMSMVIIGSRVELQKGPLVALELAGQLEHVMGPTGRWIFLIGFWGAVFSSLLGVWQSVPYLCADFVLLRKGLSQAQRRRIDFTQTAGYRAFLCVIAIVPLPVLWLDVRQAQLAYAILGSLFVPLLALTLLIMNNRREWVGAQFRSGKATNAVLVIALTFFLSAGGWKIYDIAVTKAPSEPVERVRLPQQ